MERRVTVEIAAGVDYSVPYLFDPDRYPRK